MKLARKWIRYARQGRFGPDAKVTVTRRDATRYRQATRVWRKSALMKRSHASRAFH
jgi:hypothetical protein